MLEPIKRDIRSIQLTLENEKEMLLIRVNTLENELRSMKERITVYFFEKESVEEYSFGSIIPVGIYKDFMIKVE